MYCSYTKIFKFPYTNKVAGRCCVFKRKPLLYFFFQGFNGARIPNPLLKTSYFIESIEHKYSVRAIDCATVGNVTISRW